MSHNLEHTKDKPLVFMWRRLWAIIIICALALGSYNHRASSGAGVINFKLSGEMPDFSSVVEYKLSPDGTRVVFIADHDVDEMYELYSVSVNGGELVELNPTLVTGGNVEDFAISENSQWVVYLADQDQNDIFELYSIPIDRSAEDVKLNTDIPAGSDQDVYDFFYIAENSQKVVYKVGTFATHNLYSVDIDGDADPVLLNAALGIGGSVGLTKIGGYSGDPETQRVVYRLKQDGSSHYELWSVQMDGLMRAELSDPAMGADGDVQPTFRITDNGLGVVFQADRNINDVYELFSASIDGTARHQLNTALVAGRQVYSFHITPNSLGVVFSADRNVFDKFELYSVGITGGINHPLTDAAMIALGDEKESEITSNSQHVVYSADMYTESVIELFSVSIYGTGLKRLHPVLSSGHSVLTFVVAPNSLGAVFKAKLEDDDYFQLYSADIDGTSLYQLTDVQNSSVNINDNRFQITPNSQFVVYLADSDTDGMDELYSVSILGGASLKCNVPIQHPDGDVSSDIIRISPDSQSVFYTADAEVDEKFELYRAFWGYQMYLPVIKR